jgi:hypothetical protein
MKGKEQRELNKYNFRLDIESKEVWDQTKNYGIA